MTESMPAPERRISAISRGQCFELLESRHVGRVAWQDVEVPQILPVTYAVHDGRVYFRTAPESLLGRLLEPTPVALEVDELDEHTRTGWSVVLHGQTRAVVEPEHAAELWSVDPVPWAPGQRDKYVEITPSKIGGRIVHRD